MQIANCILVGIQKTAYQAVIGSWLNFLKEKNVFQMTIKKDIKVKKQILILLI